MSLQYTVSNPNVPGCPVVIRTQNRAQALTWLPQYRVTPRDRGRDYYGLRALERRAAAIVQYGLAGIAADVYLTRN